jgi:fumarylacetoacetase
VCASRWTIWWRWTWYKSDVARSWIPDADQPPFGVDTLPYGIFSIADEDARVGVAIGEHVIDLAPLAAEENLDGAHVFAQASLNPFMALGSRAWAAVRGWLRELVTEEPHRSLVEPHLAPMADVQLHMPFQVADFVDFYASQHHAENVGKIFRPDAPALPRAWRHLPIGYHGRAGTVVPSGTDIVRPRGLRIDGDVLTYGPSARLDVEAEVGFVVGVPSTLGRPVAVHEFPERVFGVVLVNDWSARDIQAFEYVPLGPFLGKSFATSVSPWVVPLAALSSARLEPPVRDPEPVAYLVDGERWGLQIDLEVRWNGTTVSRPPFAEMYWTAAQQLAHLTANGASVRTGDLYASGTVSGPEPGQRGSFLELTWNGAEPVTLADGSRRAFLADGDTVTISATAPGPEGSRVGFGEVTGTIVPAIG